MKANIDRARDSESKDKNPEPRLVSKSDAKDDLKSLPLPEVEKRLGSSAKGLSQAEAQKRLAKYGPNEIKEKKDNLFLKFLSYFWGPIPWMIEAAVILSGVVRHWLDFFIILFLLFSNAVVAFWEEHQAGNEIAALRSKLATKARAERWEMGYSQGSGTGAGRCHTPAIGGHRAGRCTVVGRRSRASRSVRAHRRIFARDAQTWRSSLFRFDYQARRN